MDLDKYNNSSGLNKLCYKQLLNILDTLPENANILEFGSGTSTQFLIDYILKYNKKFNIDSFDNDPNFSYKNTNNYNFVNLYITDLVSCSDDNFNKQLLEKKYNHSYFKKHISLSYDNPLYWRQRNCFYDLSNITLKNTYNLVIIDGPNGNGRNIAYLHLINKLSNNAFIIVDDCNSKDGDYDYNFIPNLKYVLNLQEHFTYISNSYDYHTGGNFSIYKSIK